MLLPITQDSAHNLVFQPCLLKKKNEAHHSASSFVKTAAQFEVINLVSQGPNLEEIFLNYYSGSENAAE